MTKSTSLDTPSASKGQMPEPSQPNHNEPAQTTHSVTILEPSQIIKHNSTGVLTALPPVTKEFIVRPRTKLPGLQARDPPSKFNMSDEESLKLQEDEKKKKNKYRNKAKIQVVVEEEEVVAL